MSLTKTSGAKSRSAEMHSVAEAAVYGLPSAEFDEDVAVSIVPAGDTADLDEIHAFARERLPAYAAPTLMRIVADLPRTPTAKVKKDELRAVPREQHVQLPRARKEERE